MRTNCIPITYSTPVVTEDPVGVLARTDPRAAERIMQQKGRVAEGLLRLEADKILAHIHLARIQASVETHAAQEVTRREVVKAEAQVRVAQTQVEIAQIRAEAEMNIARELAKVEVARAEAPVKIAQAHADAEIAKAKAQVEIAQSERDLKWMAEFCNLIRTEQMAYGQRTGKSRFFVKGQDANGDPMTIEVVSE